MLEVGPEKREQYRRQGYILVDIQHVRLDGTPVCAPFEIWEKKLYVRASKLTCYVFMRTRVAEAWIKVLKQ